MIGSKKILFLVSCLVLVGAISTQTNARPDFHTEVFDWMQTNKLTKYSQVDEFRPSDSITRGEASKFVTHYAGIAGLAKGGSACDFEDAEGYDATLVPYLKKSCQYGLFKGSQKRFMPNASITEAQALAVVVRSLWGAQDETMNPWYAGYYTIAQENGLIVNETLESVANTSISRQKLATWLFSAFALQNEDDYEDNRDDDYEDEYDYEDNYDDDYDDNGDDEYEDDGRESDRDDDDDGEWDSDEIIVYETEGDSEEDCSVLEEYDAQQGVCFFECTSEEECEEMLAEIDEEFAEWTEPFEANDRPFDEDHLEHGEDEDIKNSQVLYIVGKNETLTVKTGKETETTKKAWSEVAELSPDALSNQFIESFEIYNDPSSDTSAFVHDDDMNGKWHMAVNLAVYNEVDAKEQKAIFIHELSHIITLNSDQIVANQTNCPNYSTFEGCAKASSYLNAFVQKFWKTTQNPVYSENKFVTEYAITNPEEDIAESFAFFVLESNHTDDTIRNQKVNFFNTYPELVKMRAEMRNALAQYVLRAKR